jgi:hypothetical protein
MLQPLPTKRVVKIDTTDYADTSFSIDYADISLSHLFSKGRVRRTVAINNTDCKTQLTIADYIRLLEEREPALREQISEEPTPRESVLQGGSQPQGSKANLEHAMRKNLEHAVL